MTIGERIKILRKKNDLTQEKLADFLCVSYQAVSKWECGLSSPDLSLIGPLTKLLHVSADELLGLSECDTDARREEFDARDRETWTTGDLAERKRIAEEALAEYPGDMKYLDRLAWCEAMESFGFDDDEEYIAAQERGIKHFACVIENATDTEVRASSIQGIVQYLCIRGRHDEAKKYMELYPENLNVSKDDLRGMCLQGQERVVHCQKMLDRTFCTLLNQIDTGNMLACETQVKVIDALIPDGNYLYYNCFLADNYRRRAVYYVDEGKPEEAVQCLVKSLEYATAYDEFLAGHTTYRFTSPFFDQVENHTDDICRTGLTTSVEDFYWYIKRDPFCALHDREDFKKHFSI